MMWDYMAFPLWEQEDDWDVDELLSSGLRQELQAWSDEWTDAMWGDEGPDADDWRPPLDELLSAWEQRGRQLWMAVQQELGPDYQVGYVSEVTGETEWTQTGR